VPVAKGTRFGRRPKLTKHQAREALKRVASGETLREIALSCNVDHATIGRLKARYAAEVGGGFFDRTWRSYPGILGTPSGFGFLAYRRKGKALRFA
jgi:hypothetical protein